LEDAINGVKEKDSDKWKVAPVTELKEWCNANPRVYTNVLKIKDLIKNKGVHPSGILISHDELDECCPTELSSDKDIVSGYDMNWVSLFTVKLDALGLRGVSVVDDICKMLKIQVEDIDLNHPSIYENLQNLKYPHGLFQIEADLGFKTTQKVQPHNFNELSAILALARPGASQFIDRYAGFTNGQDYEKVHPFFDDILKETGSLCLYQEQAMQMANKIGFSLDESEQIRRCISKKKIDEIKLWEDKIKHKIDENKLDSKIGDVFWKILNDSSGYQFNKSHSYSYAALTAITVYLKFNYPTEFYLSLLKMSQHEPDPISEIAKIHKEMIHIGICLLPPSLAKSNMDFSVEGSDIRFGLSSIKGIAGKTIEKLNDFKREHANKFELFESSKEAGLDIGVLSALIQAGTLDGFGKTRTHLVYEAQLWNLLKPREKQKSLELGKEYNFYLPTLIKALNTTIKDEKGKSFIKDSRFETIKKNSAKYKLIYQQNKICESFANWWYEKRLLGYAIYTTLREIFMDKKSSLIPVTQVLDLEEGRYCDFIGFIEEEPKSGLSKNKNKYSKMVISDETGSIKVMIFSDSLDKCKDTNGKMPSEEDIVIVKGKKMGKDTIFANEIAIQQNQIYTKLSDLKGDTGELKL
jgi:DNA polymerase III alpha subunit